MSIFNDVLVRKIGRVRKDIIRSETYKAWRRKRMLKMVNLVKLSPSARIVDLGGRPDIWELLEGDFHVTLVNLPGLLTLEAHRPNFTYVEHDACELGDVFEDNSFDFAFSNSTIEHVGDESHQERFARELRRLAPAYWVQTPSSKFPVEIHTGVPFYWQLPVRARDRLMQRWRRRLPAWSEMVEGTRVLSRRRMQSLFPGASCYVERFLGLEKSYSFYLPTRPSE